MIGVPQCGSFSVAASDTASANTVINILIPPFQPGMACAGGGPKMYAMNRSDVHVNTGTASGSAANSAGRPNWWGPEDAFIHVTDLMYTSTTTAHTLTFLRPLGFTWATSAVVSNTTVINVAFDPGAWVTAGNFQYPLPSGITTPALANNVVAANDWICYQLQDGTWTLDKIASTSTLAWTVSTGTPNIANGGIPAYSPIFWFGIFSDKEAGTIGQHATQVHPQITSNVNTTNEKFQCQGGGLNLCAGLHRGDPIIFQSSNGTNAGTVNLLAGIYSNQF